MLCASSSAVTTECPQFSSQAEAAPPRCLRCSPRRVFRPCVSLPCRWRAPGFSVSDVSLSGSAPSCFSSVRPPPPPRVPFIQTGRLKAETDEGCLIGIGAGSGARGCAGLCPGTPSRWAPSRALPGRIFPPGGGRALKAASKKLSERFRPGGAPLNSAPRGGRLRAAPRLRLPSVRSFLGIHHTHFTFYVYMFGCFFCFVFVLFVFPIRDSLLNLDTASSNLCSEMLLTLRRIEQHHGVVSF